MGGKPLVYNQLTEADLDELAKAKPTLTYGSGVKQAPMDFVPAHLSFDKKVKQAMCTHHPTCMYLLPRYCALLLTSNKPSMSHPVNITVLELLKFITTWRMIPYQ